MALIWPRVLDNNLEIFFAHTSFKWANNAKNKAAVIVVIVGIRNCSQNDKWICHGTFTSKVENINPYLADSPSAYIKRRSKPLSMSLPSMVYGSLINDGGNLVLTEQEKTQLLEKAPEAERFIRRYIGTREYVQGRSRYCIYIEDDDLRKAKSIEEINNRLKHVSEYRAKSSEKSTRALSEMPHKFYFQSYNNTPSIIVPRTSSEKRDYLPVGFLSNDVIIADAQAICNAKLWVFSVLCSHMHMLWVKTDRWEAEIGLPLFIFYLL